MKNVIIILIILSSFCTGCEKGEDIVSFENKIYFPSYGKNEIQPLLGESIVELTIYRSGYNTLRSATVELQVDEQLLAGYPDKQVIILPEAMYSIDQTAFSFDKEDMEKNVLIHLKNIDESVKGKNYVLPLQIHSNEADLIVEDKKTVYLHINSYRNQFQGKFRVFGETFLKYNEEEMEKIDYSASATTVSPNTFQIPSHIAGKNLWIEVNEDVVKVKEAQNNNTLNLKDLGSTLTGEFDITYQRFLGSFNLSFSYESAGRTHEAHLELNFDL